MTTAKSRGNTKTSESPKLQVQGTTPGSKLIQFLCSVIAGIKPFTLVASILPVLITSALNYSAHGSKRAPLLSVELVLALIIAISFQAIGNLNNVYYTFQQFINPSQNGSNDRTIVINLLSQLQIRRLSYTLLTVILISLLFHWTLQQNTETSVYIALASFVTFYFLTSPSESPQPGAQEFLQAFTFGPVLMCSTSIFLTGKLTLAVPFYSFVVFIYLGGFLIAQSARNAPYDRRLGRGQSSLALNLGFEWSYQLFILSIAFFLGMYVVLALAQHQGMLLLLVVVTKLKGLGDDFRVEQIGHIPHKMARLGVILAVGTYLAILLT